MRTRVVNVRMSDAERALLKQVARAQGFTVSDLLRSLLAPVLRPSYELSGDAAETIAAQPIPKPTFTGHGRHDDFARAAVAARHVESAATANEWLRVKAATTLKANYADIEHARVLGVLAD